ncbi:putative pectinesterase/pectinesterase inhibitor 28 [Impatiens glandulifera]|uniref:putative pectinesterase/pectinesterase inhibitor 28 n=1 Tax=Impatiens glandulifera TaxID=253017 RepID=UPI001FB165FE|nr:putative pectinesterase/pectinesterase inhibitor 28 [Impatiens glandulifera]
MHAAVQANHFFAKGITFENTAGASKHQAAAARVSSDMAIFYQCSFDGYQNTLFAHAHRQFYRDCTISGTLDFIFGDASALFQNCTMIVKKPLEDQPCTVTAQGREERRENTGIVLQNCTIVPSKELKATVEPVKVFLGRPWKVFSRTIVMNSNIDGFIAPEGWSPWAGTFGLDTSFYAEIGNTGAGASLNKRVTWGGIKKINIQEADEFSARRFINGDIWVKPSGVPYDSSILKT